MKIAFINGLYPPQSVGGAEIVLQTLVEGVRDQGHEVLVLTTKDGGDLACRPAVRRARHPRSYQEHVLAWPQRPSGHREAGDLARVGFVEFRHAVRCKKDPARGTPGQR